MLSTKSTLIMGLFCAFCAATTNAQSVTKWTDGGAGPDWDLNANWDFGVPIVTIDAEHKTSASDIEINTTAYCKSFTGDASIGSSRFMLIKADQKIALGDSSNPGDFTGTGTGNFLVKMEPGSTGNTTDFHVHNGDVKNVTFMTEGSQPVDNAAIQITGDMKNCRAVLSHDCDIDVTGDMINDTGTFHIFNMRDGTTVDVTGDVAGMEVGTFSRAVGANTGTTINVGSMGAKDGPDAGTEPDTIGAKWIMRGDTTLLCEGDFFGDDPESAVFVSHVKLLNDSIMTVDGDTTGSDWHIFDDSIFTADTVNTKVTGGEWGIEYIDMVNISIDGIGT